MNFKRQRLVKFSNPDWMSDTVYKQEIHMQVTPKYSVPLITITHGRRSFVHYMAITLTAYLNIVKLTAAFRENYGK